VMRRGAVCFATVDASCLCCTFLRIVSFPCRSPVRLCCLMRVSPPPGVRGSLPIVIYILTRVLSRRFCSFAFFMASYALRCAYLPNRWVFDAAALRGFVL
jgi:hypothetical protein